MDMMRVIRALVVLLTVPALAGAAVLENPQVGAFLSGIGVISGWKCEAEKIEVAFDGNTPLEAGYGTSRADTQAACGDQDNGFSFLVNYNDLGNGQHTVQAFADGVVFGSASFTVTTLGQPFLSGVSGSVSLPGFPQAGSIVQLVWQEASQNFEITSASVNAIEIDGDTIDLGGVTIEEPTFVADDTSACFLRVTIINTTSQTRQIQLVYNAFDFNDVGISTVIMRPLLPPTSAPSPVAEGWKTPGGDPITCPSIGSFVFVPDLSFIEF